jgi:hypothetical protein
MYRRISLAAKSALVLVAPLLLLVGVSAADSHNNNRRPHLVEHSYRPGELLVKLKDDSASERAEASLRQHGANEIRAFQRPRHGARSPMDAWRLVKLAPGLNTKQALERIARHPQVAHVELNYTVASAQIPNDPDFSRLWGLHNTGRDGAVPDADVDAPEAWDITTGSPVTVAVIDTGIDYTHPDLATNIWTNPGEIPGDGVDNDRNGYVDDVYGYYFSSAPSSNPRDENGHGTHVAGIIGAVANNGLGVAGVSWSAKLMALKFQNANASGTISDAIDAVLYAANNGARIINASWGTSSYSQALRDAIVTAGDAGILFVAGAGNNGRSNDVTPFYPASYDLPNLIAVAATNRFDARASISNYGANSVHLGAPGEEIYSTELNGAYGYRTGTSMAAPHVVGAAVLALSRYPALTASGLRSLLMSTVDSVPAMFGVTASGGRLNVANALNCDPNRLVVNAPVPLEGFAVFASEPTEILAEVSVCGHWVPDAAVSVSFDDGSPGFTLYNDGAHGDGASNDGRYANYWIPLSLGPIRVTVTATHPTLGSVSVTRNGRVAARVTYRHAETPFDWIDAGAGSVHVLPDDGSVTVPIGFDFPFYGIARNTVTISANGFLTFGAGTAGNANGRLADPVLPNNLIAPFWDDLNPSAGGTIRSLLEGQAPNRRFTVVWAGVPHYDAGNAATFEVTLYENTGEIVFQYLDVDFANAGYSFGASATVGVEDPHGLEGTSSSYNQPLVRNASARRFYPIMVSPEISYRVTIDLSRVRSLAGHVAMDMIDGDGINNNQVKILQFSTDGALVLAPNLVGDAAGSLVPGPARVGDAQFINEIAQPTVFGNTLSFTMKASTLGTFQPFPDSYAFYLLDQNGVPYPTNDPLGTNALFVVDVNDPQPMPQIFTSTFATASVETVGAPIARAGGPYSGVIGEPVAFDGSASSDPEGASLAYSWQFGDGTAGSGATPTHTYTAGGTYTVRLVVNDGTYRSVTASTTVQVATLIADAGTDQTVFEQTTVRLDGSRSKVAAGATPIYAWVQMSGPAVSLNGANTVSPTFTAPDVAQSETLMFQLTLSGPSGETSSDTVLITVLDLLTDSDGDALPDAWEYRYFGSLSVLPGGDPDGDGLTNLMEYQQGTDPSAPEPIPATPAGVYVLPGSGENAVIWSTVNGAASYHIYWSRSSGVTKTTGTKITAVTSPYRHVGLTNGQRYYYIVTAANNTGESEPSVPRSGEPGTRSWGTAAALNESSNISVASDGSGRLMAVWAQQNGNVNDVMASRYIPGQGWSVPGPIENSAQSASAAQVGMDSQGNAIAIWVQNDGQRNNLWGARFNATTQGWETPRLLETNDGDGYTTASVVTPQLAMDAAGNAIVAWTQEQARWYPDQPGWGTRVPIVYAARYIPGTGWQSTRMIDSTGVVWSYAPRAAIRNGVAFVVWKRRDYTAQASPSTYSVRAVRVSQAGGWGSAIAIDGNTGSENVDAPDVGADNDGNAIAVWRHDVPAGKGIAYTLRTNRYNATTAGWGAASQLSGGSSYYGARIAITGRGEAFAVWSEQQRSNYTPMARRYTPAGSWGSAVSLNTASSARIENVSVAMDDDGNALTAWRAETSSGSNIFNLSAAHYAVTGGLWGAPLLLENSAGDVAASGSVVLDRYGNAVAAWAQKEGSNTRTWVRRHAIADGSPAPNLPPIANAGSDVAVSPGAAVTLNGIASSDSDGTIVGYLWTQTAGPTVTASGANTATPGFTAPMVTADTVLTFRLVVTDNKGWTSTDSIDVSVRVPDTARPVTTASIVSSTVKGVVYYDITLSVNEPATSYFRASGDVAVISGGANTTNWQSYTGPIRLQKTNKSGSIVFEYYSVDTSGNQESPPKSHSL